MNRGRVPIPAAARFWAKVDLSKPGGCWVWTGAQDRAGYGSFRPGGRGSGKVYAHRWAYESEVGPIPEGMSLDHLCRNPSCVRPEHLEPVDIQENILRGSGPAAINARKQVCDRGHPLSGENLMVDHRGSRQCLECKRFRRRRYYDEHERVLDDTEVTA